jgi:hypothetical protein
MTTAPSHALPSMISSIFDYEDATLAVTLAPYHRSAARIINFGILGLTRNARNGNDTHPSEVAPLATPGSVGGDLVLVQQPNPPPFQIFATKRVKPV